jgi:hypothetical protein
MGRVYGDVTSPDRVFENPLPTMDDLSADRSSMKLGCFDGRAASCPGRVREQKVRAMTGRYELDEAGVRKTVERWERHKAEVIDLAAR